MKNRKINQQKPKIIYLKRLTKLTKPLAKLTKKKNRNYQNQLLLKRKHHYQPYRYQGECKSNKSNTVNNFTTTNYTTQKMSGQIHRKTQINKTDSKIGSLNQLTIIYPKMND